jgi:glycine/D-amino acid oxidase-like deaminating enzyme
MIKNLLIVGGGLLGTLIASEALKQEIEVTICDPCCLGNTPPVAILHPYPGRRIAQGVYQQQAFAVARTYINEWSREWSTEVLSDLTVIRRASSVQLDSITDRYQLRYMESPEAITEWPLLRSEDKIVCYSGGMVVKLRSLLEKIMAQAITLGLQLIPQKVGAIVRDNINDRRWRAFSESKTALVPKGFDAVVIAVGAWHGSVLKCSAASKNNGSLLVFPQEGLADDCDFNFIGSDHGHIAPCPGGSGYVVGSTYHHGISSDNEINDHDEIFRLIKVRNALLNTSYLDTQVLGVLWSGLRATIPQDKLPILGQLSLNPLASGCWIIGALASRGLLWAPYLVNQLMEAILSNHESLLPNQFLPQRLTGYVNGSLAIASERTVLTLA